MSAAVPLLVLWAGVAAALVLVMLLNTAGSLLERSGPIRLRHWAEEAGPGIKSLYEDRVAFLSFVFSVRVASRLAILALLLVVAALLFAYDLPHPVLWAAFALVPMILLSELASLHLGGDRAEATLRRLTPVLRALRVLLAPWTSLSKFAMPRRHEAEPLDIASPEEIEAFIDVGRREGILEAAEGDLVRSVVDFGDSQVRSVMTPRVDIVAAPVETSVEDLVELVLESGHSRIPIFRDSVDHVVGILHVRDLLRVAHKPGDRKIEELYQPPHFVPETKSLTSLLRELQERHQELAMVVDEYGGTEGLVTTEDLLEEIFGEIVDEHDTEELHEVLLSDGSWRVDGRTMLEDLADLMDRQIDDEDYDTVGGLIFGTLGHVPRVGDEVIAHDLRFTVEGADHRRARRVRVEAIPGPREAEATHA